MRPYRCTDGQNPRDSRGAAVAIRRSGKQSGTLRAANILAIYLSARVSPLSSHLYPLAG
jgi:hypothetical protein